MRGLIRTVVAGGLAVAVACGAGPAIAATKRVDDKVADAEASLDITSVKLSYTDTAVTARIKVRKLGKEGKFVLATSPTSKSADWDIDAIVKRKNGHLHARAIYIRETKSQLDCTVDASWDRTKDVVKIRMPDECNSLLAEPRILADVASGPEAEWWSGDDTTRRVSLARG